MKLARAGIPVDQDIQKIKVLRELFSHTKRLETLKNRREKCRATRRLEHGLKTALTGLEQKIETVWKLSSQWLKDKDK